MVRGLAVIINKAFFSMLKNKLVSNEKIMLFFQNSSIKMSFQNLCVLENKVLLNFRDVLLMLGSWNPCPWNWMHRHRVQTQGFDLIQTQPAFQLIDGYHCVNTGAQLSH